MTSQPGLQTIVIHLFPNIARNKGNQIMKFSQLIEYKMENHRQNMVEKLVSDPSGNLKLSISLDQ